MKATDQPTTEIVCYLLHFDAPLKGRVHYIGSTLYARRFARWREHALGNGSAYTKQFVKQGIGFRVVRLWFNQTREYERSLKSHSGFSRHCPICTPTLPQPEPLHFAAMAWTPTIDAHWLNRKRRPARR